MRNTLQIPHLKESISSEERERFVSILNFWHKIEFFIPFDLEQRIAEADDSKIRYLHRDDLKADPSTLWQVAVPEDEELECFRLYLSPFDKSEIAKVCNRVMGPLQEERSEEEFERTDLEGLTCFAQLTIDPTGNLVLARTLRPGPASFVSTLPWALGQFEKAGLESLTGDSFEEAKQSLIQSLLSFKASRTSPANSESGRYAPLLKNAEILELHKLILHWADFSPAPLNVIGILEAVTHKKKQSKDAEEAKHLNDASSFQEDPEPEIAILNSFFIQDIEAAIKSVESGHISPALKQFLSPLPAADRVNLESAAGLRAIWETLHPNCLNRGRWLSNPDRSMTLMQQFAVSSILQSSTDAPSLFSVNGPPGTGKTTLLQDVFADVIVRRARALAQLDKPSDAFTEEKLHVSPNGSRTWKVSVLKPELTGFEMIVASSNNAAVENISADLPRLHSLGSLWQSTEYLKPVAYKIAAQQNDGSFKKLPASDQPWGLVACALGNSSNRRRFKERLFFMEVPPSRKPSGQIPGHPQTLLDWIRHYSGPSFDEAKRRFQQKNAEVEEICARLETVVNLFTERLDSAEEQKISAILQQVERCRDAMSECERQRTELTASIKHLRTSLESLQEEERLLNRTRPGLWVRLQRKPNARLHKLQTRDNASAQLQVLTKIKELKGKQDVELHSKFTILSDKLGRLEIESAEAEAHKIANDRLLDSAQSEWGPLSVPKKLEELLAEKFQKSGLWRVEALAQKRSELFAVALSLHGAWLASVAQKNAGFLPNIYAIRDLLSGRRFENSAHALPVWQSPFLIVPIVSTTFASFHSQFSDLGSNSLGWLFVDEAGQAVPQAAVGAIWRAKRAVVIGDPLQIEPVFTLPSRFISAVAELSPHTKDGCYSPHKTSVQRLADNANKFGVTIQNKGFDAVWVGSPLRVHRRCIDPMFSWSNAIAYGGKMLLDSPSDPSQTDHLACASSWIDIRGEVGKWQEVPAQTEFILELLQTLYERNRQLPSLYLISPFKAIKTELTKGILALDWKKDQPEIEPPTKSQLKQWCKERVGTVHTFQGKEEHSVLMILGSDSKHEAPADWVCAKPNILNVALTRARRRFYLVGDRELWGARGPFAWAADRLPTISASQFLKLARDAIALGKTAGA